MEKLYCRSWQPHRWFTLCILLIAQVAFAQAQTVSGTVTSSDDQLPLPGVSVVVKGTAIGTSTDVDGKYSLRAEAGAVLEFSSMGFQTQELPVSGATLNVAMAPAQTGLEEVVVIGYGTQRKESVTGSVSSINGEALRDMPAANISQALQGRLAGVEMTQTSSQPGAAMQIRIRGTRSLSSGANDPLVVLDGIPFAGSISDLNTDDIKSIDVLKDASATAIYGSRGANGVILVTTNKGRMGQEAKFSFNSYYGLRNEFSKFPMMNGAKFNEMRALANIYQTPGEDEDPTLNTDWQDLLLRTGTIQNHNFSVNGGTERGNYNFSTTYFKDEAVVPLQDFERISLFGSLDQQIGKYLKVGFTTSSNYSVLNGNNLGMYGALSMSPIANPYNEDGTFRRTVRMPLDEQWLYSRSTLNALGDKYINQTRAFASYNSAYAEVRVPGVEGLKYRLNLGGNVRMSTGGSYTGEGVFSTNPTTPSVATISNAMTTSWTAENILSYDRTFADKHKVGVTALYSAQQDRYNRSQVSAREIPSDAFQFWNLGQAQGEITIAPGNQDFYETALLSYMGRVMYSYDDRYMISATYRSDGSSRLAPGHKWNTYPAISAGWNLTEESFMEGVKNVDLVKFRVGYGETSNQAVAPYKTLGLLGTRPYNFDDVYSVGYLVSELPSPSLGWEYSKTWNYGLDFGFFNNRLTGTFEYYITNTENLLVPTSLPPTAGVTTITANIGESQNKGFELTLNGVILDNPDGLRWDVGFNMAANRNKLTALKSGEMEDEANWWFVGKPINVIYDYKYEGLWQEGDPYLDILEPGGNVGMIKVAYNGEYNEDGTPVRAIGADDRQVIDVNPDFTGGFTTNLSYKGFDLGIVGGFQSGGVLISTLYGSSGYLNMLTGRRGNVDVDYWTPENTNARYPKPGGIMSGDNPKYGSTLGYFDASYVKIRTISLGYTFQNELIRNFGVDKLRLYATVQNAFVLWSPYHKETGLDPETNAYGNEHAAVTTTYQRRLLTQGTNTPATRNFLFGINLTF